MKSPRGHGAARGSNFAPRSKSFEGKFGRIFRTLPASEHDDAVLLKLAEAMEAIGEPEMNEDISDAEENQRIDAGFTYLGQFIDHDLTFDPASSFQKTNDPDAIVDFRTPRFDLDCVYGRGSDDQPYMYEADGKHLKLGDPLTGNPKDLGTRDLPRSQPSTDSRGNSIRRAIIGDPRNDENVIVSQLQGTIIRFHNKVADILLAQNAQTSFEEIQRVVRWHYQWVVLHDYLRVIAGKTIIDTILPHLTSGKPIFEDGPQFRLYEPTKESFIPIEFSVAAYRFGHSMVRPFYRLNPTIKLPIFDPANPFGGLNAFNSFPSSWAIDWDLFFNPGGAPLVGADRIQKAYKIDTSLVNPLAHLPDSIAIDVKSLALRNLKRGKSFGLPSGQTVARFLGLQPIADSKLKVGKATAADSASNKTLVTVDPSFKDNAPLWYYILAEAQQQFNGDDKKGIKLGEIGSRIVAETFIGLLLGDSSSFISQFPNWKPERSFCRADGHFGMRELINVAIK